MWIEIFRAGKQKDSAGSEKDWTEGDLDKIVSSYDPRSHEAPVVIGHPKDNAPAFGWVESLKREGKTLLAQLKDLAPEFVEMVKKGLFKKRSIALYPDLTLRHIGFLGAAPPAVKGLADVKFSAAGEAVEIEYLEPYQQETIKSIFQRLREWIIEKFGMEEADKIIPSYNVDSLNAQEPNPAQAFSANQKEGGNNMKEFLEKLKALVLGAEKDLGPAQTAQFSEADVRAREAAAAKAAKDQAALEFAEQQRQKDAELKDRFEALKAREAEMRKGEVVAFVEGLKQQGKIVPAMEKTGAGITAFLLDLSGSGSVLEFKEGAETKKQTPIEFMKSFLSGLSKQVEFSEVATRDKDVSAGNAAEKLEQLTKQKMAADKNLTYTVAFAETQKENPELAAELLAEIRPKK